MTKEEIDKISANRPVGELIIGTDKIARRPVSIEFCKKCKLMTYKWIAPAGIILILLLVFYLKTSDAPCEAYRADLAKTIKAKIISVGEHRSYYLEISNNGVEETIYGVFHRLGRAASPGDSLFKASGERIGMLKKADGTKIPIKVFTMAVSKADCDP